MPTLSDSIAAIKAGRRDEARVMLTQILAVDQRNVTALLWMTEVTSSPAERRIYLNRILAIDPNNMNAQRGLELLGLTDEQPPWMSQVAKPVVPQNEPSQTKDTASVMPSQIKKVAPKSKPNQLPIIAVVLVIFVVIGIFAIVENNSNRSNAIDASQGVGGPFPGDTGHLHVYDTTGKARIPVAVNETAMDELDKYMTAHDYVGVQQMVDRGTAYLLPNDTAVKVIDIKGYYQQVRILDGLFKDEAVWTYPALDNAISRNKSLSRQTAPNTACSQF